MTEKIVAVLCGGKTSSEREVSLRSGEAVFQALKSHLNCVKFELQEDALPVDLDPQKHLVFPLVHGEFGEDGYLQKLLEARNFQYAGSDAIASQLCMNKWETKKLVSGNDILTPRGLSWEGQSFDAIKRNFNGDFIVKPNDKGSSVGVKKIYSHSDFLSVGESLKKGNWIVEECIVGREMTVGVLEGKALPIVEICAKDGFYDYQHKYTVGMTEYLVPAPIADNLARKIQSISEKIFSICNCRDFARLDFLVTKDEQVYFLEVNTSPGMTNTSLLPKAAFNQGIPFLELCLKMIAPAILRKGSF